MLNCKNNLASRRLDNRQTNNRAQVKYKGAKRADGYLNKFSIFIQRKVKFYTLTVT